MDDHRHYARNVIQRLNGKPRNFVLPKPTLEAWLARIELHCPVDKLANYARYRQESETGELWATYDEDEAWCKRALKAVQKAHALGFIDEERYRRISTPLTMIPAEEHRAMRDLVRHYFPQPLALDSRGEMVYTLTNADGSTQWLTYENETWVAHFDFPT